MNIVSIDLLEWLNSSLDVHEKEEETKYIVVNGSSIIDLLLSGCSRFFLSVRKLDD